MNPGALSSIYFWTVACAVFADHEVISDHSQLIVQELAEKKIKHEHYLSVNNTMEVPGSTPPIIYLPSNYPVP
jgi:hypothetical protein